MEKEIQLGLSFREYINQFIKESGYGQKGFFVELKTGEYLDVEGYNKWIVEMKDNYSKYINNNER